MSHPEPFWTYVADHRRKPHVHPLRTPSGRVLTTVEPEDHPWQRGLWFSVKFVGEDNFWEELPPYGVLRHVTDDTVHWIGGDRETVVIEETRHLDHVELDEHVYALDWHSTLVPRDAVVLDRTEYRTWGGYGGLTLRGRSDWSDTRLLTEDGTVHDRLIGGRGRWVDITGTVEGAVAGVAFLDHPDNPRAPVPWYASTRAGPGYGDGWANFVNAAFLFHEPMELGARHPLRFRYRIVVHDGEVDPAIVDGWWRDWT